MGVAEGEGVGGGVAVGVGVGGPCPRPGFGFAEGAQSEPRMMTNAITPQANSPLSAFPILHHDNPDSFWSYDCHRQLSGRRRLWRNRLNLAGGPFAEQLLFGARIVINVAGSGAGALVRFRTT